MFTFQGMFIFEDGCTLYSGGGIFMKKKAPPILTSHDVSRRYGLIPAQRVAE